MSRGQKQQSGSSNGQQQSTQNIRRGNKTLGWYLGVQQIGGENCTDEIEENSPNQQPIRKISLEDSRSSPKSNNGEEQQRKSNRQHRYSQQQQMSRPRANSSASANKKPLNAVGGGNQQQFPIGGALQSVNNSTKDQSQQNQQQMDFHKSGAKGVSGKENYWYYDLVSDGYYYEHNGTRGWRKRNAKLDAAIQNAQKGIEEAKLAEQQKKMVENAKMNQPTLNVPSLLTAQQQLGKFNTTPNNGNSGAVQFGNPMAIKYFDNDGYFYEMASVDGWRRRQPGTTPPNSLASSFGAQPKAPSPITVPRRKVQPLQYLAYQQPPPQLNTLDLQEMMLIAQQQQHRNGNQRQHQNACCCTQTQCCANSPTTACCSTIAAMAAQLVLQKQQQMMAENPLEFANKLKPLIEGLTIKHGSGHRSLQESPSTNRMSQPASNLSNNWQQQFQHHGKWTPLGIDSTPKTIGEEKTTTITVGSFEEPYEFYWSGDEASSEMAPKSIIPNAHQTDSGVGLIATTNNAASVSSVEEDGLEEMIEAAQKRQPLIAPIGSEASAGTKKIDERRKNRGEMFQMKRPDTLKLTCPKSIPEPYVPISPGEIVMNPFEKENAEDMSYMSSSHNFDVDKFISQLPPMPVNPEQVLHSLRNPLRTPIGPPPSTMMEPSTADSPLFTPIHPGKNPWTYRMPENPWAYP